MNFFSGLRDRIFPRQEPQQAPPRRHDRAFRVGYGTHPALNRARQFKYLFTTDHSREKYAFWAGFRRGLIQDCDLSASLANPILNLISGFSLGTLPTTHTNMTDEVDDALNRFMSAYHETLIAWMRDALCLGDAYLLVNADGTLTPIPPDITIIESKQDDLQLDQQAIEFTYRHPGVTITEHYSRETRIVTTDRNGRISTESYPNLFAPYIPIVHLAHLRDSNDVYGNSLFAPILNHFLDMNTVMLRTFQGFRLMGRPAAVFTGDEDLKEQATNWGEQTAEMPQTPNIQGLTYQQKDTPSQYTAVLESDPVFFLSAGADFKYAHPGDIVSQSEKMLHGYFTDIIRHVGLPEWAWGGPIPSSRASVDAQSPALNLTVSGWRSWLQHPLQHLLMLWSIAANANGMLPMLAVDSERIELEWSPVLPRSEAEFLARVKQAADYDLITRKTHLSQLNLTREPAEEVEAAKEEQEQEMEAQIQRSLFDDLQE